MTDRRTPASGTPNTTANPSPITGPDRGAAGVDDRVHAPGHEQEQDSPEHEARHRRGDPQEHPPDRAEPAEGEAVARTGDIAADVRAVGDARRVLRHDVAADRGVARERDATVQRGDVVPHAAVDDDVAVHDEHGALGDDRRCARRH